MTGAAASIAHRIVQSFGQKRAILAVVLACAALTYGGVSLFVVAFAVYPFAAAIFKEAGIPKRLIPATIALGAFTFTMDSMPGTPQIQNIIPTSYFGTDAYAAPLVGLSCTVMILGIGMWWLERRRKQALAIGEGYGTNHKTNQNQLTKKRCHHFGYQLCRLFLLLSLTLSSAAHHYRFVIGMIQRCLRTHTELLTLERLYPTGR
ncbi:D-beta-hydroxybutyrate permease [Bacillus sp. JCM 19045]|nr:D-beta-hydroxybutyrate permease [Bacillus sp. JCM 19045]